MTLRAQKQARESIRGEAHVKSTRAEGAMHVPAFIGALQKGFVLPLWQRVTINMRGSLQLCCTVLQLLRDGWVVESISGRNVL